MAVHPSRPFRLFPQENELVENGPPKAKGPKVTIADLSSAGLTPKILSYLPLEDMKLAARGLRNRTFHFVERQDVAQAIGEFMGSETDMGELKNITDLAGYTAVPLNQVLSLHMSHYYLDEKTYCQRFRWTAISCKNLTTLNLSNWCKFTEEDLEILKTLPRLEHLYLPRCITDETLEVIAETYPWLKTLSLGDSHCIPGICEAITHEGFKCLSTLTKLQALHVRAINFSNEHLIMIFKACRQLRDLRLESCSKITDESIHLFSSELEILYLDGELISPNISPITDQGIMNIVNHCRKLRVLSLRGCGRITGNGLLTLGMLRNLVELYLRSSGVGDVTGEENSLQQRHAPFFPALEKLDLNSTQITDRTLEIISNCTQLREIDLCSCWEITDAGFMSFHKFKFLEYAHVSPNISEPIRQRLIARASRDLGRPRLKIGF